MKRDIREGYLSVRLEDIRRIRIKCRCGTHSVAEVPEQLASGTLMHPCPGCKKVYTVHRTPEGKWEINKTEGSVENAHYEMSPVRQSDVPRPRLPETSDKHPDIGKFVRIIDVTKHPESYPGARNPHPEHIGKQGVITRMRIIEGHASPVITLSDGAVVGGWECWWEPLELPRGGN